MLRSSIYVLAGLCLCWLLVKGTIELRKREDAGKLAHEADLVLHAPLARAPEIARIDASRARMLLEDALELHEDAALHGRLAYAEALEEYQKGRAPRALAALQRARATWPRAVEIEVLAGNLAIQAGDAAAAVKYAAAALALDANDAHARLLAADAAADNGDAARAADLLAALIAEAPAIGSLYNRRALVHEALGHADAARADFERAGELDSSLPEPHINLGRLLRDQGRTREAEQSFALAIERGPNDAQAWLGRGLSRIAQGDLEGGALDVQHARELAPAEPGPLLALADIDAWHNQLDSAVERYRAALTLAAHDAVAWLKLGNALTRKREFSDARAAFEHAISEKPELAAAHNGLGAALMGLGDSANAEKAFATAATLDERDPNPLLNLALLHKRMGDRRAARDARAQAEERAARVN
jgi:tetratricopeptide (TPR) repeat protein